MVYIKLLDSYNVLYYMFGITWNMPLFLFVYAKILVLRKCSGFGVKMLGKVAPGTVWKAVCKTHQFRQVERKFLHIEYIFGTSRPCCALVFFNDNI